jgi:thiamine-monophosphate kinase
MTRLDNIGERRLIDNVFSNRYARSGHGFGDDCAFLFETEHGSIVASTDPAPRPVAWELGFKDYFYWGWLLAACNLSDLAAAGAEPKGLLSSLTLPGSMELKELTRFLDGLDQCSEIYDCPVVGGNIKEGTDFRCEATVVGQCEAGQPLSRHGARLGDLLIAVGRSGSFWSAVLALKNGIALDEELFNAIVRPTPQLKIGNIMRSRGLAKASTDASDGLYYAMHCLTVSQNLGFRIEPERIEYSERVLQIAEMANIDPLRLILGFGDMQLVCAIPEEQLAMVRSEISAAGEQCTVLGTVTRSGLLQVATGEGIFELANFDNERLTADSQFTAGFDAYQTRLLNQPLTRDGSFLSILFLSRPPATSGSGSPQLGLSGARQCLERAHWHQASRRVTRPQHRVGDFLPVAREHGLVGAPAWHARPAETGVSRQRLSRFPPRLGRPAEADV